jgi:TBC1 domain family member 10
MLGRDEKQMNARLMKWREMLRRGVECDPQLLVRRTRKGIPASIRIKVWPELVKMESLVAKTPLTYSKILLKDCYDTYDIRLDIPRTFSFQSQEVLKESLFNVLKALSIEFPQIGYCQGMNFLAMRLLEILEDEVVFYIIASTIHKYKPICTHAAR